MLTRRWLKATLPAIDHQAQRHNNRDVAFDISSSSGNESNNRRRILRSKNVAEELDSVRTS